MRVVENLVKWREVGETHVQQWTSWADDDDDEKILPYFRNFDDISLIV
jgi:hypothetical protein